MKRIHALLPALACSASSGPAAAKVDRIEIASRAPLLGGRPLGAVGPYERLCGWVFFSVEAKSPSLLAAWRFRQAA